MNALTPYLLVGVGGFFGALARFLVSHGWTVLLGSRFPFGTFVVNVSGSFLLGLLYALILARVGAAEHAEATRLALGVGFLASFTTFSTFELDTHVLLTDGWWGLATANILGSVVGGLLALRAGMMVARAWL
jgi:CrcB protein